jgi:hypothetical protein
VYEIATAVIFGFLILAAPGAIILRILGVEKDSPVNWFFAFCLGLIFFVVCGLCFGVEAVIVAIVFLPIIAWVAVTVYSFLKGIYCWICRVIG